MTPDRRAIDVLLIEDDPGDILIIREALETHEIHNILHVARDGQEGLDYLYQRGSHKGATAAGFDPARLESAEIRRPPTA